MDDEVESQAESIIPFIIFELEVAFLAAALPQISRTGSAALVSVHKHFRRVASATF